MRKEIKGIPLSLGDNYKELATEITKEVNNELDKIGVEYFSIIYGSYPNAQCTKNSDIDIGIGVKEEVDGLSKKLGKIVTDFHEDHKLGIDNEVPLDKKLVNKYEKFELSSKLGGFDINNGNLIIPDIEKTKEYLNSDKLLKRLLFNNLTIPVISSSNSNKLDLLQKEANKNLFLLGLELVGKEKFSISDLRNSLYKSNDGKEGEMFLGYKKEYDILNKHLNSNLLNQIDFYLENDLITKNENGLYVINEENKKKYIKNKKG